MQQINIQQIKFNGQLKPTARFGHTLTMINRQKAILFGGAVGDSGKFIITNETYQFDFEIKKWEKLDCIGEIPSQRAAHAACQFELNQLMIFGGAASGSGGLSNDDLYLLNIKYNPNNQPNAAFIKVPTTGPTPGKRYGHIMIYQKPHLIVYGGNTGLVSVNDVWILNFEKQPYQWQKQCTQSQDQPIPRVYHSASICNSGSAAGMVIIFGGRSQDQQPLNDSWGLRKHRNGVWDWIQAPYKQAGYVPQGRYQHKTEFLENLMVVVGGRTAENTEDQGNCIDVYDTETSEWAKINFVNRYRHSTVISDGFMYIHGGFEPQFPHKPLDTMICVNLNDLSCLFERKQTYILNEKNEKSVLMEKNQFFQGKTQTNCFIEKNQKENKLQLSQTDQKKRTHTPIKQQLNNRDIRLSNQVIVATTFQDFESQSNYYNNNNNNNNNSNSSNGNQIKKINILDLQEESKKLNSQEYNEQSMLMMVQPTDSSNLSLIDLFINTLCKKPQGWKYNEIRLPFKKELILKLCEETFQKLLQQNTVLRLRVPLKIFGNLFGRFNDLLRFFDSFGCPIESGDIEKFDYLFLGNYVDEGFNSLETVLLLFALKCKFPDSFHLLKGSHEERKVNKLFGFAEECAIRLSEDIQDPNSVYQKINQVFDALPLAALCEDNIMFVHGGLGPNVNHVNDIMDIKRPISAFQNPIVYDLLFSDYNEGDFQQTSYNKQKDYFGNGQTYTFSEKKVEKFLQETGLHMIIRSKECVQEGIQRNKNETVTTITSQTDYMGKYGNKACMIKIKKNFQIEPCIIQQISIRMGNWIGIDNNIKSNIFFTEEEQKIRKRQINPLLGQFGQ